MPVSLTYSHRVPSPSMLKVYKLLECQARILHVTFRASQKSLNPLTGIAIIVRAGAVEWGGGDPCGPYTGRFF